MHNAGTQACLPAAVLRQSFSTIFSLASLKTVLGQRLIPAKEREAAFNLREEAGEINFHGIRRILPARVVNYFLPLLNADGFLPRNNGFSNAETPPRVFSKPLGLPSASANARTSCFKITASSITYCPGPVISSSMRRFNSTAYSREAV